jgi:UDP-N-acetylglucosamine--N-acetylmuramyl-(pentapeptide) pyrophosphoryl-undecaprenol N-acetylglucosamine transferase
MTSAPRIVIAGGGSGGHVFPGLAIAEAVQRGARAEVVFAGTARGLEARIVPERGYPLEVLDVLPIKGQGAALAARGVFFAARSVVRALFLVRRLAPRIVVSVGGYAAGPVALAACILRVPVAIVEPNGVVGLANRILAPFASRAYIAFDVAAARFAPEKIRRFGVPLRRGFAPRAYEPSERLRVLVLGGSQGASVLNARLPEAIGTLVRSFPTVDVLHQAGKARDASVRDAYVRYGVKGANVVAFLDDVASELACADVVVARSGAGTVAEIAAVGRPALLVPFPYAADDHQTANALALEHAGGAICVKQTQADVPRLVEELSSLLGDRARRIEMSRGSRSLGKPDAATDIARDLCELAEIPWSLSPLTPSKVNGSAAPTVGA